MSIIYEDRTYSIQNRAVVNGNRCKVFGNNSIVNGDDCDVYGNRCVVNGDNCAVYGKDCIVNGSRCDICSEPRAVNGRECRMLCDKEVFEEVVGEEEEDLSELRNSRETLRKIEADLDRKIAIASRPSAPPASPTSQKRNILEELSKIKDTESDKHTCSVCLVNEKIIALPCGHTTTCAGCTADLVRSKAPCPYCRKPFKTFLRIFN